MSTRVPRGPVLLLLALPAAKLFPAHGDARSGSQAKTVARDEPRERLLAAGRILFVDRCAKCHAERGDKPLKSGLPLNQRELSEEEIARAVSVRLKNATVEDKRTVVYFYSSHLKRHSMHD